jgi:hypothetical protein
VTPEKVRLSSDNPHRDGLYADSARKGIGIVLADGNRFILLKPDPAVITPQVIAHSISKLCRFTGHTSVFYSVAQHCVMVSKIVPPELAMQGLLHDASEAFIGDVSRPLKAIFDELAPGVLYEIEERIHEAIAKKFGSGFPHDPLVKAADNVALVTEKRDLIADDGIPWLNMPEPLPEPIKPLGPRGAQTQWLARYEELGGKL